MASRPRTSDPSDELAEEKARTLGLRRQLLELEHRRRAGELVRAERVMRAVSGLSRMERDMWINSWPARSAPLIACDLDIRDDAIFFGWLDTNMRQCWTEDLECLFDAECECPGAGEDPH